MEADSTHWITDPARRFQSWAQLSPKPGTLLSGPRFRSQVKFVSTYPVVCLQFACLTKGAFAWFSLLRSWLSFLSFARTQKLEGTWAVLFSYCSLIRSNVRHIGLYFTCR